MHSVAAHTSYHSVQGSSFTWPKFTFRWDQWRKNHSCNSRPIIGIEIVGGRKTNVKEQVALSHLRPFSQQSRWLGLYFFSRSNGWTGLQMSKTMINSSSSKVTWDMVTYSHSVTTILLDRDGFLDVYYSTVKKQEFGRVAYI